MDNDFRSLDLGSPFRSWGRWAGTAVYRELSWNETLVRNGLRIRRSADPDLNEIQYRSHVIRHPLKIDGVVYPYPGNVYLWWDSDGVFRGVEDTSPPFPDEALPILIDYADKYMGLHNFDFWKVVNDG